MPKNFKFRAGPSLAVTAIMARPARVVWPRRCCRELLILLQTPRRSGCRLRFLQTFSADAFLPAMRPCTAQRAKPCRLNPPADSPPQ